MSNISYYKNAIDSCTSIFFTHNDELCWWYEGLFSNNYHLKKLVPLKFKISFRQLFEPSRNGWEHEIQETTVNKRVGYLFISNNSLGEIEFITIGQGSGQQTFQFQQSVLGIQVMVQAVITQKLKRQHRYFKDPYLVSFEDYYNNLLIHISMAKTCEKHISLTARKP